MNVNERLDDHERILVDHKDRLDGHDQRLVDGDKRMTDLEKDDLRIGGRVDLLCQSMDSLIKQFERFFGIISKVAWGLGLTVFTSFVGFVFWYIQSLAK